VEGAEAYQLNQACEAQIAPIQKATPIAATNTMQEMELAARLAGLGASRRTQTGSCANVASLKASCYMQRVSARLEGGG
jgi:hypothetical protein